MSANNTENPIDGADNEKSEALQNSETETTNENGSSEETTEVANTDNPTEVTESEVPTPEATTPEVVETKTQEQATHSEVAEEAPGKPNAEETPEAETPKEPAPTEAEVAETSTLEVAPVVIESKSHQDIEEIEEDEDDSSDDEAFIQDNFDFSDFDKKAYVGLAEKMLDALKKTSVKRAEVRNIDAVTRDLKSSFDDFTSADKAEALKAYITENGNREGFDYRNDNLSIRFESLIIQIREEKQAYFRKQDALREDYFERKTNLLTELREVVDLEEKGGSRENWERFKKIQQSWKDAGNVASPHNGSLWSAYNALLDRYFDIRSIQNELKELDRKKNLETRTDFVVKIEAIAATLKEEELTPSVLKKANEYLNDYKHTGPGPRAEQEVLWDRMKAAFDIIYDKKRSQDSEMDGLRDEIYEAKSSLVEKLVPYTEFNSESINEWNEKSKEIMAIQEQWNALKGPMPKDKAKDTSKAFWGKLKHFFKNKSAFFAKLESEREGNLKAKEALCEEVEAFVNGDDTSPENTRKVIELQKTWKSIGHVPKKQKDSIYKRFKKACDAFFDLKRNANKEQINEYKENLAKKQALCETIEKEIETGEIDLDKLPGYKKSYGEMGFVPRGDMDKIQDRFIKAINNYLKASGDFKKEDLEKALLKNEVEVTLKAGGNPKALQKQEYDLKRKLKTLDDDINQLKTNIEFFGHSKGAEQLKAEYEKKIQKSENEADKLREKLNLIRSAT